ncbi:bifunctional 3-(3-hydroxy-phenyl)propionate/3-hydroxycinnamic acid hydroxylase MhpA [Sphingomonas sp. UYP23]
MSEQATRMQTMEQRVLECDVAIVGAGPVGLLTALLLGRRGLSVSVFERWPNFYPLPRACTIDHEAIRILQGAGLSEKFEPLIDPVIGPERPYKFLNAMGETLLQIDWNRPGTSGWAQANGFFQPDLEKMIVRKLEALPQVQIMRGCNLTALEQGADDVHLKFSKDHEQVLTEVQARFVIGADGARSTVRELLDIEQTDLGFSYEWLVVDVVPHDQRIWDPYVVQHCNPARPTTLVNSGPGRRRWEFMRLPDETVEELNTLEMAWSLLAPWDITPHNATLERHAVYTFRGSWANQWGRGRVFLAGDAAHLMPPFLGQGLCSGMRDAIALAWRLIAVLKKSAPEDLLGSYGLERSTHVQEIIQQAVEMGRIICMLDPAEVAARDERMKAALKDRRLALRPPPEPRLGDGNAYIFSDRNAGYLSIQGRVRRDGREGLFDDVVGGGWQLLWRGSGDGSQLDRQILEQVERFGGVVANLGPSGETVDLDESYSRWFDRLGVDAVLVRPDFYVFGSASTAEVHRLVASAAKILGVFDRG